MVQVAADWLRTLQAGPFISITHTLADYISLKYFLSLNK